jgi:hypothetical protein
MATNLDAMPDPCSAGVTLLLRPTQRIPSNLPTGVRCTCHKSQTHRCSESSDDFCNTSRPPYATFGRPSTDSAQATGKPSAPPSKLYTPAPPRVTLLDLKDFVDISTTSPVKNEEEVMLYYRRILQMSNPLYNSEQLTDEQRNAEFFGGFHIKDRDILVHCLKVTRPDHPADTPWDLRDS